MPYREYAAVCFALALMGCFDESPRKAASVFDVSLGLSPGSLTINPGTTQTTTVNMIPSSDNQCLGKLTASGPGGAALPGWLTVSFNDDEPSLPAHVPMLVTIDSSAPVGMSTIAVQAAPVPSGADCTDSSQVASASLAVTVPAAGAAPVIASISPSTIIAGGASFTLTVNGSNFIPSSAVNWNGNQLSTAFVSAARLTAQVPMSRIANPGTATITVVGPGTSNAVTVTIFAQSSLGIVTVISESSDRALASGLPNFAVTLSEDGRYSAFGNEGAMNLVADPVVSQNFDVYWHDSCVRASNCSVATKLASVIDGFSGNGGNDGNKPSGPSLQSGNDNGVSISNDGRYVAFLSHATNLVVPNANNGEAYLRDTCTGVPAGCTPSTRMISLRADDGEPNSSAQNVVVSGDGAWVAFVSFGTNLVASPNPVPPNQTYLRTTARACASSSCTLLVSVDSNGNPFASGTTQVAVSHQGRFVVFSALANPGTGSEEVFVRDTCKSAPAVSDCRPSTSMVSLDNGGNPAPTYAAAASISDDGRFVAFTSTDRLAPGGLSSPNINLYLRDTCETESGPVSGCVPSTTTASVASDGTAANAGVASTDELSNPQRLSRDGRFVIFNSSATNLVAGGAQAGGVFVRDTCTNAPQGCAPTTVLVSVNQDGRFVPGQFPVISADGHYCAFMVGSPSELEPVEQVVLAATSF